MASFNIPQDKQWKGQFPGNYSGNLWQTLNIDMERLPGRISLANKLRRIASGLGVVHKFIKTNARQNTVAVADAEWWGLVRASTSSGTNGDMLRNGESAVNVGTWITDDTVASPNDVHDMVVHENANGEQRLLVTRASDVAILNRSSGANAWDIDWMTTVATGGADGLFENSGVFHPCARLQRLVAIGDKDTNLLPIIRTIDKDDVVTVRRLSFGAEYTVRNIYSSSNRFWIGLQHNGGGRARIIEWDGFSLTYNNEYEIDGAIPLCGFIVNDIPYFLSDLGVIQRFNGGGFEEVQRFDFKETFQVFTGNDITNYGAFVDGEIVKLNVRIPVATASATDIHTGIRRYRSGVYVFNTRNLNLYHNMSFGEHETPGTDVNYSSHISAVGSSARIAATNDIVASAAVYTGGATWLTGTQSGIYTEERANEIASNTGRNRGYFITPFLPTSEIEAKWEALWVKFRRFANSANRIIIRWRTREPLYNSASQSAENASLKLMNAEGDWVTTTTFTCIVPIGVAVGDMVEILSGDNGGCCFNISALSATPDNDTSITVTIDEAAPTSSTDTFLCRFDNFRSETAISSTTVGNQRVPFTVSSTGSAGNLHGEFIQLMVELRGFDNQVDELIPVFKSLTNQNQT